MCRLGKNKVRSCIKLNTEYQIPTDSAVQFPPLSDMNTPRIAEPRSPFDVHDMLVPSTIGTADITHQRTRSDENVAVAKDIPFHKRTLATARKISLDQLYSTARSHEKAQHTTHPPPANRGPLRKLMHLSIAPAQMG